jgi:hypothetical protein
LRSYATPYFKQASDQELNELAGCDYGGDYPADAVARFFEDTDEGVAFVFKYLDARGDQGFECHVDIEQAQAWIRASRPDLAKELELV